MKRICLTLLAILALAVPSTQAGAQSWPTRPIRAIVPYTAGSGTDVTARVILNQLSSELGQSIVVENRVGAEGTIGTAAAAKSDPDGYTILVQSSALTIAPSIYQNLTYDTARDLTAVALLGVSPNVLIIHQREVSGPFTNLFTPPRLNRDHSRSRRRGLGPTRT